MLIYKLTRGGQVSIPAAIRKRWKTREVVVEDHGDHAVVRPAPENPLASLKGAWLKYIPEGMAIPTTDEVRRQLREEEQLAEDRKYGHLLGNERDQAA